MRLSVGERWIGPARYGGKETRTVADRTLGADVVYITGRRDHYQPRRTCSEADWQCVAATCEEALSSRIRDE